jgi:hypothetical protein
MARHQKIEGNGPDLFAVFPGTRPSDFWRMVTGRKFDIYAVVPGGIEVVPPPCGTCCSTGFHVAISLQNGLS